MGRSLWTLAAVAAACWLAWMVAPPPTRSADASPLIHIDVVLSDSAPTDGELAAAGFQLELRSDAFNRVQGWIGRDNLATLRRLSGVRSIAPTAYGVSAAGAVVTEGDLQLGAEAARQRFGVDGSGVRIAVISDGVLGLADAQDRGEAPTLAAARAFGAGSLTRGDEGTAMIEIIHDLAPGAEISFGAVATDLDHIEAVRWFAQRVDVIVDDLSFFYPADQTSDVSRNTTQALAHPDWPLRAYVTAAGNWARQHWAGEFRAGRDGAELGLAQPGSVHDFGRQATLEGSGNSFTLEADEEVAVVLFWDDDWGRATRDYQLYLLDVNGRMVASSQDAQAIDSDIPRELLTYRNNGRDGRFSVVIQNWADAAAPAQLDVFVIDIGGDQPTTLSVRTPPGSILAQGDAEGAITVGAASLGASADAGAAVYSSRGPTANGAQKPELIAVDGVAVSAATSFRPRFFGTSAAAPHVAAVAALTLSTQPLLMAADGGDPILERRLIRDLLLESAVDAGPDGVDLATGWGRIDAEAAIEAALDDIIPVVTAADSGPGSLRAAIERVNSGEGRVILLDADLRGRDAILRPSTLLPPLSAAGAIIDGSDWTLDATNVDVGLFLVGDGAELWGLRVIAAREAGVVVRRGVGMRLESVVLAGNRGDGLLVEDGGGVHVANSRLGVDRDGATVANGGAAVRIAGSAGPVRIAPRTRDGERPQATLESDTIPPIAPLTMTEPRHRSGRAHQITGVLLIDGTPAPRGTLLETTLDRRPLGAVAVGDGGSFALTVWGPGREIRFQTQGIPTADQIAFRPGGDTAITIRAALAGRRLPPSSDDLAAGNLIAGGATAPIVMAANGRSVELWGNQIRDLGQDTIAVDGAAGGRVQIELVTFAADAALIRGTAGGAARVDLYGANGDGPQRLLGSAPVIRGAWSLERIVVADAHRFWAVAFNDNDRPIAASAVWESAPPPQIASVSDSRIGVSGGERLTICGAGLTNSDEPQVWIGGVAAQPNWWSETCVEVRTPPRRSDTRNRPVDLSLRRSDGRIALLPDALTSVAERRVALEPGWNVVTWEGAPIRTPSAIATLAGRIDRVLHWDAATQAWLIFAVEVPASLNTLLNLNRGDVIWVYLKGDTTASWAQLLD